IPSLLYEASLNSMTFNVLTGFSCFVYTVVPDDQPYESSSPAEQALALPHPQSHQWEHDLTSQSFHVQPGLPKILLSLSKDLSIEVD
uniref:Uncharacterized protein n=1 Tax=Ursus americanus TaxID=9643 RepID=A0A452S212_URSAM